MTTNLVDRIDIRTDDGTKSIELHHGDIIHMSGEGEADLLLVSSFPGDYTPTASSLIGALFRHFGIRVGELAQDKEEDLRKTHSCWWSRRLPEELPYRRILCFESSSNNKSPQNLVQDVFRALVSCSGLFNRGIAIAPLLSTGDQGHSKATMLAAMVRAALLWMKNGLNMKNFKIVVRDGTESLFKTFADLKRKLVRDQQAEMLASPISKDFDFYISASSRDLATVQRVRDILQERNKNVTFYTEHLGAKMSSEELFDALKSCSRTLAFLSPSYLEDARCVEEYNAAWCLNRLSCHTRLTPMLCDQVNNLPTYISLVQWVDIRNLLDNLESAVMNVNLFAMEHLQQDKRGPFSTLQGKGLKTQVSISDPTSHVDQKLFKYDLFVSYAHKTKSTVDKMVALIQERLPYVRIFLDTDELRAGCFWQESLYHSLEQCQLSLAFISPAYVKSRVCQEEYRLSQARHFTEESSYLVPIVIEDVEELPTHLMPATKSSTEEQLQTLIAEKFVPAMESFLKNGICDGVFFPYFKRYFTLTNLLEDYRSANLTDVIRNEPPFQRDSEKYPETRIDILVSRRPDETEMANDIAQQLNQYGFKATVTSGDDKKATLVSQLDSSDLIVALMSTEFLTSPDLIQGLQVAINRHRYDKDQRHRFYPILLSDVLEAGGASTQLYCNLLLYELCLTDQAWEYKATHDAMVTNANYSRMVRWDDSVPDGGKGQGRTSRQLFIGTAVNRIIHYATKQGSVGEVLIDIYKTLRGLLLADSSNTEQKKKVLQELVSRQI